MTSDEKRSKGLLTMAATHLGNIADIPLRSLAALRDADLLIFEEDRPARSFLKAAGVTRPYLKYSEHAQSATFDECTRILKHKGWVCYMSDQGTPGLADPGRALVALAQQMNAQIQVIPGPSSLTAAITVCPFDCFAFHYLGFLPQEPQLRISALKAAAAFSRPLLIMDTPYRLKHLLGSCHQVFGKSRKGFVAVDITGEQEDFWLGSFADLQQRAEALTDKLNFVLIVDAPSR